MSELSQLEQKLVGAEIYRVGSQIDQLFATFIRETHINNTKLFIGTDRDNLREVQAYQIWTAVLKPIWEERRKPEIIKSVIQKAVDDLNSAQKRIADLEQQLGVYQDQISEENHF